MTRKRFNKLLMAKGYDRNRIAAVAKMVSEFGTYEKLYNALAICTEPESFSRTIDAVISAAAKVAEAVFRAFGVAATATAEVLNRLADSLKEGNTNNENN